MWGKKLLIEFYYNPKYVKKMWGKKLNEKLL